MESGKVFGFFVTVLLAVFIIGLFVFGTLQLTLLPASGSGAQFDVKNSSWRGQEVRFGEMIKGGSYDVVRECPDYAGECSEPFVPDNVVQACDNTAEIEYLNGEVVNPVANSWVATDSIYFDVGTAAYKYSSCSPRAVAIIRPDWSQKDVKSFEEVEEMEFVISGSGAAKSVDRGGNAGYLIEFYEDGDRLTIGSSTPVHNPSTFQTDLSVEAKSFQVLRTADWDKFSNPDIVVTAYSHIDGGGAHMDLQLKAIRVLNLAGQVNLLTKNEEVSQTTTSDSTSDSTSNDEQAEVVEATGYRDSVVPSPNEAAPKNLDGEVSFFEGLWLKIKSVWGWFIGLFS